MKNIDWKNVNEATERIELPAGGYVCQILRVKDNEEKERLEIEYDICEGEFTDYFTNDSAIAGFWTGMAFMGYKKSQQPFFKSFLTSVKKSNPGFIFNNDETTLINKRVGFVLAQEKSWTKEGKGPYINISKLVQSRSIDAIHSHDYKIPDMRVNDYNKPPDGFTELPGGSAGDPDDVPF